MMMQRIAQVGSVVVAITLTGCGVGGDFAKTLPAPAVQAHASGSIQGGQQPVNGATIQLYETSTSGYFAAARPMLTQVVSSNADGSFNITQAYTCTAGNQVYLTATGGNPGLAAGTNNAALALMAGIGSCSYLLANRNNIFLNVNEVTTVAAAWSLSRFMSSPVSAGTSATNAIGLSNAFGNIANVVNAATGKLPGTTLPSGATLPTAEIYTLANILSACINSDGNLANGSACQQLFSAATPPGGAAPTDTITAALDIANNPASNVAALFALSPATAPFQPSLTSAPNNWLVGIRYTGGGLAQPAALAVDAGGNIWTANPANNSASLFSAAGVALSPATGFTDPSLAGPAAIALDGSGNAWLANASGATVTGFSPSGSVTGMLVTNLSHPSAIAFDATGNAFVSSPGTGTLVEFAPNQTFSQQVPLNATAMAIAINPN